MECYNKYPVQATNILITELISWWEAKSGNFQRPERRWRHLGQIPCLWSLRRCCLAIKVLGQRVQCVSFHLFNRTTSKSNWAHQRPVASEMSKATRGCSGGARLVEKCSLWLSFGLVKSRMAQLFINCASFETFWNFTEICLVSHSRLCVRCMGTTNTCPFPSEMSNDQSRELVSTVTLTEVFWVVVTVPLFRKIAK